MEFEKLGDRMGAPGRSTRAATWRATRATCPRRRALRESLRLFREVDDGDGVATSLADLARLAREDGDLGRARAAASEVLALGSIGRRATVRLLEELAALAAATGDAARALVLSAAAAALRDRLGMPAPASKRRSEWR